MRSMPYNGSDMELARLEQQIRFIIEIDKLKSIYRRTCLINERRNENTAKHSWHIAVMLMIFSEYANAKVDIAEVLKMTTLALASSDEIIAITAICQLC